MMSIDSSSSSSSSSSYYYYYYYYYFYYYYYYVVVVVVLYIRSKEISNSVVCAAPIVRKYIYISFSLLYFVVVFVVLFFVVCFVFWGVFVFVCLTVNTRLLINQCVLVVSLNKTYFIFFSLLFQHCFTITYKSEGQRQYDLRSDSEGECNAWIDAIKRARLVYRHVTCFSRRQCTKLAHFASNTRYGVY